jgi:mannose-6-phosphate isomerase
MASTTTDRPSPDLSRLILKLENGIQPYAWGSTTMLAEFLGRPNPSQKPQAELWIGAHPVLPSQVATPEGHGTLGAWIGTQPEAILGRVVLARFGAELPFLLKVLAIGAPLSIQCHPSLEQARAGCAGEDAAGLPRNAPERNYRDTNHKPELIAALTPVTALKGFRPVAEIDAGLGLLDHVALVPVREALRVNGEEGLRGFFSRLMALEPETGAAVAGRAAEIAKTRSSDLTWQWVGRLTARYPRDIGVLGPLYLNLLVLEPGEALYLPAGELHAYLDGLGVEIMANSDNVLRGGLTPKHVDVPELLRVLTFRAEPPAILEPRSSPDGVRVYTTPATEFELGLCDVGSATAHTVAADHGLEILLVLAGAVRLVHEHGALILERGEAAFVPAAASAYRVEGEGRLARARVPARP